MVITDPAGLNIHELMYDGINAVGHSVITDSSSCSLFYEAAPKPSSVQLPYIPDEIYHQCIAAGPPEKQWKRLHCFLMQEYVHFGHKCRDKQIFKVEAQNQK